MIAGITAAISELAGIAVNPAGSWAKNTVFKLFHDPVKIGHSGTGLSFAGTKKLILQNWKYC